MKSQVINTNQMTLQPFFGRLANQIAHNLTGHSSASTGATIRDYREVIVKRQITNQGAGRIGFRHEMNGVPNRNKKTRLVCILLYLTFVGVMIVGTQTATAQDAPKAALNIVPMIPPGDRLAPQRKCGSGIFDLHCHLNYYGGPVVPDLDLVIVFWAAMFRTW